MKNQFCIKFLNREIAFGKTIAIWIACMNIFFVQAQNNVKSGDIRTCDVWNNPPNLTNATIINGTTITSNPNPTSVSSITFQNTGNLVFNDANMVTFDGSTDGSVCVRRVIAGGTSSNPSDPATCYKALNNTSFSVEGGTPNFPYTFNVPSSINQTLNFTLEIYFASNSFSMNGNNGKPLLGPPGPPDYYVNIKVIRNGRQIDNLMVVPGGREGPVRAGQFPPCNEIGPTFTASLTEPYQVSGGDKFEFRLDLIYIWGVAKVNSTVALKVIASPLNTF